MPVAHRVHCLLACLLTDCSRRAFDARSDVVALYSTNNLQLTIKHIVLANLSNARAQFETLRLLAASCAESIRTEHAFGAKFVFEIVCGAVQVGMRVDLELADGSKACGVYIHNKLSDSAG